MYLYVDSFKGLSRDEVLQKTFDERLTPDERARVLKWAEEAGVTYMDVLRDIADDYDDRMADPVQRKEVLRVTREMDEKMAMPFGPDPQLEAEGDIDEDEEAS